MPWAAKLDDEGPRNGDVIVRTAKGRLVAVIYAAESEEETMRRAEALLRADIAPCSWCNGDLAPGELCACNTHWPTAELREARGLICGLIDKFGDYPDMRLNVCVNHIDTALRNAPAEQVPA